MRNTFIIFFVSLLLLIVTFSHASELGEWQCDNRETVIVSDKHFILKKQSDDDLRKGKYSIYRKVVWTEKSLPELVPSSGSFKGYSSTKWTNYQKNNNDLVKIEQLTMYNQQSISFKYEEVSIFLKKPIVEIGEEGEVKSVKYREDLLDAGTVNLNNCLKVKDY